MSDVTVSIDFHSEGCKWLVREVGINHLGKPYSGDPYAQQALRYLDAAALLRACANELVEITAVFGAVRV
jgi:hypothetical protein